jgi:diguanylate cyclase (GGDEF)-like protein
MGFIGLVSAAFVHLLFIPMFLFLNIPILAFINIFSVSLYAYAIYGLGDEALIKHNDKAIGWIVYFELLSHGIIATYYLGLESGFHYYIYSLTMLPFFISYSLKIQLLRLFGILFTSLFLNIYFREHIPFIDINRTYIFILGNINITIFIMLSSVLIYFYTQTKNHTYSQLLLNSNTDILTQLYNRRYITETAERLIQNKITSSQNIALLIIDIDHFKNINDTYGHAIGDEVIKKIGHILKNNIHKNNIVARWGGEEFIILFPSISEQVLNNIAENLITIINHTPLSIEKYAISLSITCGGAIRKTNESFLDLFIRTDKALYRGKNTGRNRYIFDL